MNEVTAKPEKGESLSTGRSVWIIAAVAIGFLLILGYGLRARSGSRIGDPAPDFTLSLFDGGELSLADRRGAVVVVNFWASWCPPCRDEAPALERVWQEYEDRGVLFVGVSYKDVDSKATAYIEEFDITYPNGPDPYGRIAVSYGITGVPETFLIDEYGRLVKHYVGPINESELRAVLEEILRL